MYKSAKETECIHKSGLCVGEAKFPGPRFTAVPPPPFKSYHILMVSKDHVPSEAFAERWAHPQPKRRPDIGGGAITPLCLSHGIDRA